MRAKGRIHGCLLINLLFSTAPVLGANEDTLVLPTCFSGVDEDCGSDVMKYLTRSENSYAYFVLSLPRCNQTSSIQHEPMCAKQWCATVDYMIDLTTCKQYTCTRANFFPDTYGFAGLEHGPGTMHPCGRAWAVSMVDRCADVVPGARYPGCGPYGPGSHQWEVLTPDITAKLTQFGWTEELWDNMEPDPPGSVPRGAEEFPEVARTCWGDLDKSNRVELQEIGYSPEGWHSCGYMARRFLKKCEHPTFEPRENGTCIDWRIHAEAFLWGKESGDPIGTRRTPWAALTKEYQGNLTILGFTNTTAWDNGDHKFALRNKLWAALSEEERAAAIALRFNIFSWDGCPHTDCIDLLPYVEQFTYPRNATRKWAMLSNGFRDLISVLGWEEDKWDMGTIPIMLKKPWDSLELEVQAVAQILGHTEGTWEKCPRSNCIRRLEYMNEKWWPGGEPIEWTAMPIGRRQDWETLGVTSQLWRDMEKPRLYYTSWDLLTDEEKTAARNLGYVMSSWDGCANPVRTHELDTSEEDTRNPFRLVQGEMSIHRAFVDISEAGKVTKQFMDNFKTGVTRSMFCDNMYEKDYEGQCYDRDSFERQAERLTLIRVEADPLKVIFRVAANRTDDEISSLEALEFLKLELEDPKSSIRKGNFSTFANVAKVKEIPFSQVAHDLEKAELDFEKTRKDSVESEIVLEEDSSVRHESYSSAAMLLFLLVAT